MNHLSRFSPVMLISLLLHPILLPAEETVAISSVVFNGYTRERLPDGTFKPEYYVFGEGGASTRPIKDPWMEKLTFNRIGHIVAAPLAKQNYLPAFNAADVQLLILVFWGSTEGSRGGNQSGIGEQLFSASSALAAAKDNAQGAGTYGFNGDPATAVAENAFDSALWMMGLENRERDRLDSRNALILGYSESLEKARFASHMSFAQDILSEISGNRYFVVLQAYDFKTATKETETSLDHPPQRQRTWRLRRGPRANGAEWRPLFRP